MSKEQFEAKKSILDAMDSNQVKTPAIPVDVALQEAENLYVWCQGDKAVLVKAGLDWALVTDLPIRIGALRYIQSQWQKEYMSLESAQKEWADRSPGAYNLRDELVHHFLHAFYNIPDLYARAQAIAEGNSHADMIQDLSDLAVLGRANQKPLLSIGLNVAMLDQAEAMSAEMASLLARANGKRMEDNQLRVVRDKAFAHLKEAVDEIRRHGQYAFWRDDARHKGYVSLYIKAKRHDKKSTPVKEG